MGVPVNTQNGENIISVNALKDSANLVFFKGVLLGDKVHILEQQASVQSGRRVRFTNADDILKLKELLISYINEAIEIEERGQKVEFKKNP